MKRKVFFTVPILFFACVFLFSGYNLIKIWSEYAQANAINEELQNQYVQTIPESTGIPDNADAFAPETTPQNPAPIQVDFDALLQKNKDVVGWLYLPDSPVNYPVVQAEDNNKYLRRDLNGKRLSAGTLFVDYRNGPTETDRNYIIYGHNMKNGSMFHCLANYKKQSFYETHPVFYYLTPEGNYKIELFAGTTIASDHDIYIPSPNTAAFADIIAKSTFQSDVLLAEGDCVVTLSTCSYEYDEARYVVLGKLTKL